MPAKRGRPRTSGGVAGVPPVKPAVPISFTQVFDCLGSSASLNMLTLGQATVAMAASTPPPHQPSLSSSPPSQQLLRLASSALSRELSLLPALKAALTCALCGEYFSSPRAGRGGNTNTNKSNGTRAATDGVGEPPPPPPAVIETCGHCFCWLCITGGLERGCSVRSLRQATTTAAERRAGKRRRVDTSDGIHNDDDGSVDDADSQQENDEEECPDGWPWRQYLTTTSGGARSKRPSGSAAAGPPLSCPVCGGPAFRWMLVPLPAMLDLCRALDATATTNNDDSGGGGGLVPGLGDYLTSASFSSLVAAVPPVASPTGTPTVVVVVGETLADNTAAATTINASGTNTESPSKEGPCVRDSSCQQQHQQPNTQCSVELFPAPPPVPAPAPLPAHRQHQHHQLGQERAERPEVEAAVEVEAEAHPQGTATTSLLSAPSESRQSIATAATVAVATGVGNSSLNANASSGHSFTNGHHHTPPPLTAESAADAFLFYQQFLQRQQLSGVGGVGSESTIALQPQQRQQQQQQQHNCATPPAVTEEAGSHHNNGSSGRPTLVSAHTVIGCSLAEDETCDGVNDSCSSSSSSSSGGLAPVCARGIEVPPTTETAEGLHPSPVTEPKGTPPSVAVVRSTASMAPAAESGLEDHSSGGVVQTSGGAVPVSLSGVGVTPPSQAQQQQQQVDAALPSPPASITPPQSLYTGFYRDLIYGDTP